MVDLEKYEPTVWILHRARREQRDTMAEELRSLIGASFDQSAADAWGQAHSR
jgi:hypothetical protein